MADAAFITCASVVKIHTQGDIEVQALQGLDLSVAEGELLALVGPSGSGKSTLLNILGGLDRPTGGRVRVAGFDLMKLAGHALDAYRARHVGFVWQKPSRNLLWYLTARENAELPLLLSAETSDENRRWTRELLDRVGLAARTTHRMAELSGGELQRLSIVVALARRPRLLLADEPTGELDSETGLEILGTLKGLNRSLGITTIIVTHDAQVASHVDRVLSIRDGKTSSVRIRQTEEGIPRNAAEPAAEPAVFREYTVVDSAGRMQIPPELRERLSIRDLVELDVSDAAILVRPVQQAAERATAGEGAAGRVSPGARPESSAPGQRGNVFSRIVHNFLRRSAARGRSASGGATSGAPTRDGPSGSTS